MQVTHLRFLDIDHRRGDMKGVLGNRETARDKSSLFQPPYRQQKYISRGRSCCESWPEHSHFMGSSVFPVGTIAWIGASVTTASNHELYFFCHEFTLQLVLSLNYLRVIFCSPCSEDIFHENNLSLQNCVTLSAFLSHFCLMRNYSFCSIGQFRLITL
jgi:hypothetical protein